MTFFRCFRKLAVAAVVVSLLGTPLLAQADDWAHNKKLAFDTTENGISVKEDVAALPVLVRLHSGNFTFSEAKPDGSDLRFFAADGKTPLKFHIEKFDVTNELASVWVALPKLTANSTADSIVMAWGNPKAAAADDSKGTFDASQIFVLHFADAEGVKDATANAIQISLTGVKPVATGPISAAAGFDGKSHLNLAAAAALKLTAATGFTFSSWIKPVAADNAVLYAQQEGGNSLTIGLAGGKAYAAFGSSKASAATALKPGEWQQLVVVGSAGKVTFYLNGNPIGNGSLALSDIAGTAVIGEGFNGELDEVTLAGIARTESYVKALASSQNSDTPMMSFADGEAKAESINYFAILLGAVTIDGWVVIGILMVMLIISFYVMITKTMMIIATAKANLVFLEKFKDKSVGMLTPGHQDAQDIAADPRMKKSSIFHLYAMGLGEVEHRFTAQTLAGKSNMLSGAALDAIRAALDASMVRENQRLNSGMVLLTIAIAGGPFLGLLGTVVGVMITFAAIAAAGDVNVNAIAPGIAAALVATVAGLGVAIPALFGYNWLSSQIKNVSADTQVFADEFLTKSAEMNDI